MTSAASISIQLQPYLQKGLSLWIENDLLRFKAPKELTTPELVTLLKQNKEAIIVWLQQTSASEVAATVEDEFPLASTQGAIWMLYRFAPVSPAYNTAFACTLKGELNESAIRKAFHALMIRHPMLRSTFHDTDEGPRQRVWNHLNMPLQMIDGSGWNASELDSWLANEADSPFELTQQSCLRVKIVRNSQQGNVLIATIHHVGADLWALLLVAHDIKSFYQRAVCGEVLSVQLSSARYRQHVEWQQALLQGARGKALRRYWQKTLQGAPITVTLPADFSRPPVLQLKTRLLRNHLDADTSHSIRHTCRQHGITPFIFIQSALQIMVHHFSGANEFLIGTPTMGRSQKGMDQVVGDFANPVVLRAQLQQQMRLCDLFVGVKASLHGAMEHQDYPFAAVVQDCNPPRDSSRTPLFQLMFVWHQGSTDLLANDDWIDTVLPVSGPRGSPYDVMLAVSDLGDRFEMNWTYQDSLYRDETINRYGRFLQLMMQAMLHQPDGTVVECIRTVEKQDDTSKHHLQRNITAEYSSCIPSFEWAHHVVVQKLPDGREMRRLFVEYPGQSLPVVLQRVVEKGIPGFDDITVLPNLPRNAHGLPDDSTLSKIPLIDHISLLRGMQAQSLTADQVAILHERVILPGVAASEIIDWQQQKRSDSIHRTLDITQRPDAWVSGEPFELSSDTPSHLFMALEQTALRYPGRGILFLDDRRASSHYCYVELVSDARRVAAALKKTGLSAGSILLLQMRYDQRFFAVWWGSLLAGFKPLNVATPDHYNERSGVAQKLYNVANNYQQLTIVADHERLMATRAWLGDQKQVIDADALLHETEMYEGSPGSEPVAFLQLTSGSTGTPKSIQITHRGILHHIAASAIQNEYGSDDINLNWLPFDHVVPILTTHIKDCVLGIRQIQLTTRSVLEEPLWWLQAMSEYRVTHSWAPNFAFQRVLDAVNSDEQPLKMDLSTVRYLMNAGEQVLESTVQNFQAAFELYGLRENCVQPAFGMAEACTCITYNNSASQQLSVYFNPSLNTNVCDITEPHLSSHGFVDLGPVMPGIEVRITDDKNQQVKEGVIGRMQIRGPVVTPGYLENPDANAEAFVGDGWFNSGDLGFIWNRRLILTGREKEMIVVNGANYYCFELEKVATITGVLPTFVAATGVSLKQGANSDELVVFYVPDGSVDAIPLERQMAARIVEAFGLSPAAMIPVSEEQFYKTTSGKIQRGQFKKQFEGDVYAEQVNAFQIRHHQNKELCTSLFALAFEKIQKNVQETKPGSCIYATPDMIVHPAVLQMIRLDTEVHILDLYDVQKPMPDREENGGCILVLLGDIGCVRSGMNDAMRRLTGNIAQLKSRLMAVSSESTSISELTPGAKTQWVVGVLGERPADVLLLKPLLETLRQETGMPDLKGCVLSSKQNIPPSINALRHYNRSVMWFNGDEAVRPLLRPVNPNSHSSHAIATGDVYAITGGLAALAEPLCHYLVKHKRGKVILLGRSALMDKPRSALRFQQLQRKLGACHVNYQMLSAWSTDNLHKAITAGLSIFNETRLGGIFHLAGHLEMAPLESIDEDHWQKQWQPKWQGACCVADYMAQYAPQGNLIHYGSMNAYFGGRHAAAYSLANATQSWQTEQKKTNVRTWNMHWSVWENTGMAARFSATELQLARNKGLLPLDAHRDLFWLDTVLAQPPGNYYIGIDPAAEEMAGSLDFNVHSRDQFQIYAQWLASDKKLDTSQWIIEPVPAVDAVRIEQQLTHHPLPMLSDGSVDQTALRKINRSHTEQCIPPATAMEKSLLDIWCDVLGRDIPDVTRSFFEYGGHSINATQLISRINKTFAKTLTVAHLFQYATIRELAGLLVDNKAQSDTSLSLGLGLNDFIQRADDYRLDCVNPSEPEARHIVFLPTASGLSSAYLQMMAQLKSARLYVLSLPKDNQSDCTLQYSADRLVDLLLQSGMKLEHTMLVGWSMGGVLGFEMIRQLRQKAMPLPELLMLDSGFADGLHPITYNADFQLLMFSVELGLDAEKYATFNHLPDAETKLAMLHQHLRDLDIKISKNELRAWSDTYKIRLQQLGQYAVVDPVPANRITLMKAEWHSHGRHDLGWDDADKNIKWQSVATDHQGIVKHPAVVGWLQQQYQ